MTVLFKTRINTINKERNTMKLSIENAHSKDAYITFEEGPHIYTVHGKQGYTSVTTFIHKQFSNFDADKIIDTMIKKGKLLDCNNKYYGMTREEIKNIWYENGKSASESGTKMHYDIECYYNDVLTKNESIEYQYFRNFVNDFPILKPYRTEWMIYDEDAKISGSVDMVFEKPDGTFEIYDWKRVKEIKYEDEWSYKTSKTDCLKHIPDTNFWHYSLQLNTYRYILEKNYGIKITGMFLVCLHPENPMNNYERIQVHDLRKEVEELFEQRCKNI